jgi:hypothetical protein
MPSSVTGQALIDLFQPRLTANSVVSANHEQPQYVLSSGLLLLPLSWVPVSSLPPNSRTSSAHAVPSTTDAHIKHVPSASGAAVHTHYVDD